MFEFVASAFGYILNFIYNLVNNYGYAIIIFTLILKIVMLPLSIKQQKTMKKTTKMQAKVKEIQEKYSNDQLRMSQELTDLYKRENMSPFSGCLSTLVHFVIILSMFYLVSSPLTYMKHIEPEIVSNYAKEVMGENNENGVRYPEIAIIKQKASVDEKVNINMEFLGLDLSDVPSSDYEDPKVFIIPALYVITSLITTKLMPAINNASKEKANKDKEVIVENKEKTGKELVKTKDGKEDEINEEEAMAQMNKSMSLMMPFMTVSIACIAPLGLALYWLVSNLLNIIERLIINKVVKEEEE